MRKLMLCGILLMLVGGVAVGQEREPKYPDGPGDSLVDLYVTVELQPSPPSLAARGRRESPLMMPDTPSSNVIVDGPWDRFAAEDRAQTIVRSGLRHENFLYPPGVVKLIEFRAR